MSVALGDVLGCADLSGIAGWYSQAGTPHLDICTLFNAGADCMSELMNSAFCKCTSSVYGAA